MQELVDALDCEVDWGEVIGTCWDLYSLDEGFTLGCGLLRIRRLNL